MAIWQVPISLISQKSTKKSKTVFFNSINALSEVLPEEKSWCTSIKQYGNIDSTCLEIYFGNSVPEVELRIDLRSITKEELSAIIDFANKNSYKAKYSDEILEPTLENFIKILSESDANQFVSNPHKYLKELSENSQ